MKTRNQLNNRIAFAPDLGCKASNHSDHEITTVPIPNSPTSPPRLRDRRLFSTECKSQPNLSPINSQSTSPLSGIKKAGTGPTRVLPRRSCGKVNSLLAWAQGTTVSANKHNSSTSQPHISHAKKNTHRPPSETPISEPEQSETRIGADLELPVTNKTANIRNYSRDIPATRSANLPKDSKDDTDKIRAKPVCITLPDKSDKDSSNSQSQNKLAAQDMCTYVFTKNGLKKIRSVHESHEAKTESSVTNEIQRKDSSSSDLAILEKRVFKVLLGVTGSVATIKLVDLIKKIKSMFPRPYISKSNGTTVNASITIKVVMTSNSKHFISKDELIKSLEDPDIVILEDSDEWSLWKKIGDPVLHIELRKWADLCLIAPLDANTMAKLASGICDNLLTCVVRAWDISKPLIYCPAMNVHMYEHPVTKEHLSKLQSYGYLRVDCVEKKLACGDFGMGGMASVDSITNKVVDSLIHPVARKVSLSRPLLDQQPTYPIISTTENPKTSSQNLSASVKNQILNRFRTGNQITIHAVASSVAKKGIPPSPGSKSNYEETLAKKMKTTHVNNSEDHLINNKSQKRSSFVNGSNGGRIPQGVTSVQNLKAVIRDNGVEGLIEDVQFDEEPGFDFDPSKLLEQTMITEDLTSNELESKSVTLSNLEDISASALDISIVRMGGLTPLFNTSKFLALCHNKERDCFTCAICKHDYKNRKSIARHLKEQHVQGNIYHCKPCGVSYKRREKLIKHNKERHPESLEL